MAVNAALTTSERNALIGGATTCRTYMSIAANSVVATATVASTPTAPMQPITVSGTSGGWGNIALGQTFKVTDSGGSVLRGYYRVRGSDSTHIFPGAMGLADPGLLNADIRTAAIQSGDLITVYNRFDAWAVIPRIDYTNPTVYSIYEDYNSAMTIQNVNPAPIVQITANGHNGHIATFVDATQSYATITFVARVLPWPGQSAPTYLWTLPSGFTLTSGSITSSTFTAQVARSATNYALKFTTTCTGPGGTSVPTVRYVLVWVHDTVAPYLPLLIDEISSDSINRTGRRMTIDLKANRLASIPDGTLVHIWDQATWNGSTNATFSFTDHFTGWVQTEDRHSESGLQDASIDILGPSLLMETLNASSQYFQVATSPGTWQQVTLGLSYLDFMIYWIVLNRSTLLNLFDYVPLADNSGNSQSSIQAATTMPTWDIPNGSLLSQCQALAARFGANFGCDSVGQFVVAQHPNLVAYASRGALVTRDTIDSSIYSKIDIHRELKPRVRRLRGEAFVWDGVSLLPVPLQCDAPGSYPGQGSNDETFQSQLVSTQAVLNTRTGLELAHRNNLWPSVTFTVPSNRSVYEPAHMQFVRLTLPATYSVDGNQWQHNVVPNTVTRTRVAGGALDIEVESETETAALDAVTIGTPPSAFVGSPPPQTQPWVGWGSANSNYPVTPIGIIVATTGGHVARGTTWTDLSPGSLNGCLCLIQDPFNYRRLIMLNSSNTAGVQICDDCTKLPATWRTIPIDIGNGNGTFLAVGNIVGSMNRQGFFAWLTTEYPAQTNIYYQYTTDYFQTQRRVLLDTNNANRLYGVAMGSFNAPNFGVVFASAGNKVYSSADWGNSWGSLGLTLSNTGGIVLLPYSITGGGGNGGVSPKYLMVFGNGSGNTTDRAMDGTTNTLNPGAGTFFSNFQQMCSYILDGNYFFATATGLFYASSDGGKTWASNACSQFGCVSGWPTNNQFALCAGAANDRLQYTLNAGSSFTDISSAFSTFRIANWGSDGIIASAFGDLAQQYPKPVTQ